ncbi:hypothetical protein C8E02_0965 [Vogesella indigofera]|uniref:Uncharacterized protein n=1 Tax=Vogesella indigofera TaxID=45465 RepID=A0A495BJA1_VOGIN|nr:hypothetical protein [Vogesella indigofera]RKQ61198.1 hypothetical protein C8E02_0965 [Vogesella indigofera]
MSEQTQHATQPAPPAQQQAQPVAWGVELTSNRCSDFGKRYFVDVRTDIEGARREQGGYVTAAEATIVPLYAEPPHPRAQLMRVAEAVRDATKASAEICGQEGYIGWSGVDLAAIVDAIQPQEQAERCQCSGYLITASEHKGCLRAGRAEVQPAPVNQQLLAALKLALDMMVVNGMDIPKTQTVMMEAIAAAESAQAQQPADGVGIAMKSAMRKWFYEEFEDELLANMEAAGLIAQAEGYSISMLASMEVEIDAALAAHKAQEGGAV